MIYMNKVSNQNICTNDFMFLCPFIFVQFFLCFFYFIEIYFPPVRACWLI